MEVLLLDDRETLFSKYPKVKDNVRDALKRGSVVVVGKPEQLVEVAKEASESFWYRLFLCHPGCPEEIVETLAKLADGWEVYYSVRFEMPKEKVSRREALSAIFKRGLKGRLVALPEVEFSCASPYCDLCKLACPENAIRLKERRVVVDPDKCTSCGLCVAVCPLYSLGMPGLDINGIFAAMPPSKAGKAKELIWKRPWTLKPEDFKDDALVLLGIQMRTDMLVNYVTKVLGWRFCDEKGCLEPEKVEPRPCPYSPNDEELSPLVVVKVAYSLPPKFSVVVDERLCDACTACSEACPTSALRLEMPTPSLAVLKVVPALCVGCFACVKSCPVQEKVDALGLGLKVISVLEDEDAPCEEVVLVKKKTFRPQCALCGRQLNVDPEEFVNAVKKFVKDVVESGELDNVYTAEGLLEKADELLKVMLCKRCYELYKSGKIPPVTVARLLLLAIGCVYEQEGMGFRFEDPLARVEHLFAVLGLERLNYCSSLNVWRGLLDLGAK